MDRVLAAEPLKVPVMLVHSLWDQEDIYGDIAVYKAIKPKDIGNDKVFLVMGPWHHGQEIGDGSSLGPIKFGSDTGLYFRQEILRPFLAHYLKDGAPKADLPPLWRLRPGQTLGAPPLACRLPERSTVRPRRSTSPRGQAGFFRAQSDDAAFDEYISDPAKPVPYRERPIQPMGYAAGIPGPDGLSTTSGSLRPSGCSVFVSELLNAPVKITGQPVANLVASTSGTDSDWVVKFIDLYPDEVAGQPTLGGYQLMISADIFRGRYRESLEKAKPIAANQPLTLSLRFAHGESCFPSRPSDYGADPVQLVSVI